MNNIFHSANLKPVYDKINDTFLAVRINFYLGLRVGELLALTPEDIDFDRHIISVNKNYQRLNGKDYP